MTTNPKRTPANERPPETTATHAAVAVDGSPSLLSTEPASSDVTPVIVNPTLTAFVRALARAAARRDWVHDVAGNVVNGTHSNDPREAS